MAEPKTRAGEFALKASRVGAVLGAALFVLMTLSFPPVWVTITGATVAFTVAQMAVFTCGMGILGAGMGAAGFGLGGGLLGLFYRKKDRAAEQKMQSETQGKAPSQQPELGKSQQQDLVKSQDQLLSAEPTEFTYFRDGVNNSRALATTAQQR